MKEPSVNMKKKTVINLSRAVFKGLSYPPPFQVLIGICCLAMLITVSLSKIDDELPFVYIYLAIAGVLLYFILFFEYYNVWLLEDRIVYKYSFRFSGRFKTVLLTDIKHMEYRNKTGRHGPGSIVILFPRKDANWKRYKIAFNDWRNKRVFDFLNIMYSRGFEIDISSCIRESLVADQIKLGIRDNKKLLRRHY
jgi:hypothetical protein